MFSHVYRLGWNAVSCDLLSCSGFQVCMWMKFGMKMQVLKDYDDSGLTTKFLKLNVAHIRHVTT